MACEECKTSALVVVKADLGEFGSENPKLNFVTHELHYLFNQFDQSRQEEYLSDSDEKIWNSKGNVFEEMRSEYAWHYVFTVAVNKGHIECARSVIKDGWMKNIVDYGWLLPRVVSHVDIVHEFLSNHEWNLRNFVNFDCVEKMPVDVYRYLQSRGEVRADTVKSYAVSSGNVDLATHIGDEVHGAKSPEDIVTELLIADYGGVEKIAEMCERGSCSREQVAAAVNRLSNNPVWDDDDGIRESVQTLIGDGWICGEDICYNMNPHQK